MTLAAKIRDALARDDGSERHLLRENSAEILAALRDKERMDWIERQEGCGFGDVGYGDYRTYAHRPSNFHKWPTAREVIDRELASEAARNEQETP